MDLNEFSTKLTAHINDSIQGGIPLPFAIMALDMCSFELKSKHLAAMNKIKGKELFVPVIEEGGKQN